ncbi:beta-N-acetylhexosaminidase [Paenibacillus alkaliterrae]|uniref:beta-N-acetylhexosaminidase n=1 Tax=Paenibacillus alkaliterrae TaxID=320909 RepID=UPI001F205ADA|nr:beta-N-acetylhexosaminidase [Paenibacillus alkaliterrae]MCF2937158.1 beta-N-acetylhexosaminidase [Paenibacillus alkaliterrae]
MRKMMTLSLVLFLLCSLLTSCSKNVYTGGGTPEPSDSIKDLIASMSMAEKVGQMVIVGLEGHAMTAETEALIEDYHVGGFILYKDNISDASQTVSLLNQLKKANRSNKAPLWLSIDQEGGIVNRMPAQFTELPSAEQIGNVDNTQYSRQIGQALGGMVRSLGFNMNFAPVLDINSNPNNPVIGSRSYGADPQSVILHGMETMMAIQSKKIAAVVKHFPGHGDTSVDSHLELPVINKSLTELQNFELIPFKEAIKQNTDAIMIAHLLLPKVDEKDPASISHKVITDLLRNTLQYDGLVITDDMTMGGITKHYDVGEAAVKSVQAGSDILLIGHDHSLQLAVLKALNKSAEDGAITEEMLDRNVYRILRLKAKYNIRDSAVDHVDIQSIKRQIESALKIAKTKG